jgi:hypothetical protein
VSQTTLFIGEIMGSNLGLQNSCADYRLVNPGFDSLQGRRFFLVQHVQIGSGVKPPDCQMAIGGSSHGVSDRGVKLTNSHVLPSLRMGGALHQLDRGHPVVY